jgi:hypothetical protein
VEREIAMIKSTPSMIRDRSFELLHEGYRLPIKLILEGVTQFSRSQFAVHGPWLLPILPSLITSSDFEIRLLVSKTYSQHVNPIALKALEQSID